MLSALFLFIASALNAVMDALENENFYESIFSDMDETFWYKRKSWKFARKVFSYKIDAWHLAKSGMIIFFLLAIVSYEPVLGGALDVICGGLLWNFTFWLFYHKLFGVK